jgi:acetylornithine deacetylase/succinyl-diaminopimelate desuccinylase-like protein
MADNHLDLILNRTWRPQLAVIGIDGYPKPEVAGNVLLPETVAKLSLRLPPTCDAKKAIKALKRALEANPPYNAEVRFAAEAAQAGWNAPSLPRWLEKALNETSQNQYGKPAAFAGEGGSIPFMAELGRKFPRAQFMITGVLGPKSNAHGPNEFLHIPMTKKLTACVAETLTALAARG